MQKGQNLCINRSFHAKTLYPLSHTRGKYVIAQHLATSSSAAVMRRSLHVYVALEEKARGEMHHFYISQCHKSQGASFPFFLLASWPFVSKREEKVSDKPHQKSVKRKQ